MIHVATQENKGELRCMVALEAFANCFGSVGKATSIVSHSPKRTQSSIFPLPMPILPWRQNCHTTLRRLPADTQVDHHPPPKSDSSTVVFFPGIFIASSYMHSRSLSQPTSSPPDPIRSAFSACIGAWTLDS